MTDKEKIRNKVKKLQKRAEHNFDISLTENERQFWLGESNVLTLIGKYIDSLQEEPETKFKIGDRIRLKGTTVKGDTIIKIYTSEVGNTYFEFKNSDIASADLDWELVEEPKDKCKGCNNVKGCITCVDGSEWAHYEEPVSEELEKAAVEAFKQIVDENRNSFLEIFKAGAQWMHKKMIHEFNLKEE